MLLEKTNAELLKLVAECKDFPADFRFPGSRFLDDANIGRMLDEELLCVSGDGRRYRVSRAGYDLLNHAGFICQSDVFREADEQVLTRREQTGQVMLTLMSAGVDVFTDTVAQLCDRRFISAGKIRRIQRKSGQNISGNTRFTGLMGGSGYAFYYIANPNSSLFLLNETNIIKTLIAQSRSCSASLVNASVVYMGKDYHSLCSAVTGSAGKKASFRTAYDAFTMPVHLCPCTPDGAVQMRIMLQPDYRARLIKMLYPVHGLVPPEQPFLKCDGIYKGEPVILGVDMDLRRINSLIYTARMEGKKVHIFSRPCQTDALMAAIGKTSVSFYNIQDNEITDLFSFASLIKELPIEPYITPKGGYIDDKAIRACREARKARGTKDKTVSDENQGKDG